MCEVCHCKSYPKITIKANRRILIESFELCILYINISFFSCLEGRDSCGLLSFMCLCLKFNLSEDYFKYGFMVWLCLWWVILRQMCVFHTKIYLTYNLTSLFGKNI